MAKRGGSSAYTVEPIRAAKKILAIKNLLKDNPRDLLLFILGINTWLPVSHLLTLKVRDVIKAQPRDGIRIGKSDTLYINQTIYLALQNFFQKVPLHENDFLFISRKGGKPLTVSTVHSMVQKWAAAVGLSGHYGAQSLRKTCGYYHWIDPDANHECIRQTFGHSSIALTKRFLGITDGKTVDKTAKVIELDEKTLLRDKRSPLCLKVPPESPIPSDAGWLSIMNLMTSQSGDMVRLADKYGINIYSSPSHFEHLGYTAEERLGKLGLDIVPDEDVEAIMTGLHELGKTPLDNQVLVKYRIKHADGHYVWIETYFTYIQNDDGSMKNLFQSSNIIPEQKKTSWKIVKKPKHHYFPSRDVMGYTAKSKKLGTEQPVPCNMVPGDKTDLLRIIDMDGRNIYVSPSHFDVMGYTPEERVGKSVTESLHPDDLDVIMDILEAAKAETLNGLNPMCIHRIRHKNGHYIWVETLSEFIRDLDGKVNGMMQFTRLVPPQKKATAWLSEWRMAHMPPVWHEMIEWIGEQRLKLLNIRKK
jgi:PAS domain S-box-containing protein